MKETTQLGVELIGDRSIDADAEMIVLAVRLLESSGLDNFQLDIGHVGFFKALASEAGLDQERMQDLRLLIESKNYFGVESFVEKLDIPASLSSLLLKLPELFGTSDVLSQARNMTDNPRALQILR